MDITLSVPIHVYKDDIRKIYAIKGIRALTNMSLREAKRIVDTLVETEKPVTLSVLNDDTSGMKNLEDSLLEINTIQYQQDPITNEIVTKINDVIAFATITGHFSVSKDLVTTLQNNFPFYRKTK